MGDSNSIQMGDGAQAKQVAQGQNITQTIIERQIVLQQRALLADARFSLPRAPENFTGRADEIETLVKALTRERGAAITGVSGMGGIGKSALAAVAAQRVAQNFPDAQIWIDMRGLDKEPLTPADAMRQVILAFEPEAGAALKDLDDAQLAQTYRGVLHAQRALIVLDNARDNAQIRPLLQADGAFLVTARATLSEAGLQPLRLGAMEKEDARDYVITLCPRLQMTDDQGRTAELCELCGYLPLALKIAGGYLAARANVRVENYLARLREARLALLREGATADVNVEAAFVQTYDQLTPAQRTLFGALPVFPASFTLSAAAYVWGLGEIHAEAVLGELLRMSLVEFVSQAETRGRGNASPETGERYRVHDLLREFAEGRRVDDERRMTNLRHAEFYEQVARAARSLYEKGGENILAGLKLFDQELAHIRAGQKWAAENMERDADAARLCDDYPDAAAHVRDLRLSARENIAWLEAAVRAAKQRGDKYREGNHLGNLGSAYADLGDVRKAIALYEQRIEIAREIGDRRGEGTALGNLGSAYADLGDVRKAIALYEQVLVIHREIGDRRGEGNDLGNLGVAYKNLGDVRKAIEFYEQQLAIVREIGDRRGEGATLGNLGLAYAALGDVRKAIEFYEQALAIDREIGDRRGEGTDLGNLGNAYAALGDVRKAIAFYEQHLAIAREIGDRRGEGTALGNLGNAYAALGDVRKAIEVANQALAVFEEIESPEAETIRMQLTVYRFMAEHQILASLFRLIGKPLQFFVRRMHVGVSQGKIIQYK